MALRDWRANEWRRNDLTDRTLNSHTQPNVVWKRSYNFIPKPAMAYTCCYGLRHDTIWAARSSLPRSMLALAFYEKNIAHDRTWWTAKAGSGRGRTTLTCLWNAAHWLETTARTEMRKLQTALVALSFYSQYNEVRLRRALAYNACVWNVPALQINKKLTVPACFIHVVSWRFAESLSGDRVSGPSII